MQAFQMIRYPGIQRAVMALLACVVAACTSGTGTDTGSTTDPIFLRTSSDAPSLTATTVRFYAVRGQDREVRLYYHSRAGHADSTEFLRFRVTNQSLLTRPDGSTIANGDSLQITFTVADAARMIIDFQPSGLRFADGRPARLKLKFAEASHDFNGDGVVDARDAALVAQFAIWKREAVGLPWLKLTSLRSADLEEIEADVTGFTQYAVAY